MIERLVTKLVGFMFVGTALILLAYFFGKFITENWVFIIAAVAAVIAVRVLWHINRYW